MSSQIFKVVISIVALFLVSSVQAGPKNTLMKFKDVEVVQTSESTATIKTATETIVIEKLAPRKFKINGQVATWKKSDTMEAALDKVNRAYAASKKSANLDDLIFPEAHAIAPAILYGGFGLAVGGGTCGGIATRGKYKRGYNPKLMRHRGEDSDR